MTWQTTIARNAAVAGSEAARIVGCSEQWPDDRRAAMRGAYLEGASFDIPLNTMRKWLCRSLIALRECLTQTPPPNGSAFRQRDRRRR